LNRRVVVTGVGLVSAVGIGTRETWKALLEGRCGIGPITHFDASQFSSRIAGEVKDFDPLRFLDKKEARKMDVFIHYALAASSFAMEDSGLQVTSENGPRVGVYIGSGIG
jgi:3-oxoacyl-[acyl-carrier-protein] synthase II